MNKENLVKKAINDFIEILKHINGKAEVAESFRARCREIPYLIENIGLVPALSFCYAKAGTKGYKEIVELIKYRKDERTEDETNSVKEGYAFYLYFVLKTLNYLKLIKESDVENPIEALKKIIDNQRVATTLIRPYIIQLKKLSEAMLEEQR